MKILSLSISRNLRETLKKRSMINNFPLIDFFYFLIPSDLNGPDRNHFFHQGSSFFSGQFNIPVDKYISIQEENFDFKNQKIKELSWEIFYRYNYWIKVRSGVFDDDLNMDISGFTGKIIDFYSDGKQNLFQIAYSGETIKSFSINQLLTISKFDSPFYTILESDLIMPFTTPIDNNDEVKIKFSIVKELVAENKLYLNEKSLKNNSYENNNLIIVWENELASRLINQGSILVQTKSNKKLLWTGIHNSDDFYGIWGMFEKDSEKLLLPLTEIEKVFGDKDLSKSIKNYQEIARLLLPN
jgi:hypothetical protein